MIDIPFLLTVSGSQVVQMCIFDRWFSSPEMNLYLSPWFASRDWVLNLSWNEQIAAGNGCFLEYKAFLFGAWTIFLGGPVSFKEGTHAPSFFLDDSRIAKFAWNPTKSWSRCIHQGNLRFWFWQSKPRNWSDLLPRKPTNVPWKILVGRWKFLLGWSLFWGTCSFSGGVDCHFWVIPEIERLEPLNFTSRFWGLENQPSRPPIFLSQALQEHHQERTLHSEKLELLSKRHILGTLSSLQLQVHTRKWMLLEDNFVSFWR